MTFSINELSSNINRYGGVARPNKFSVMITPPAWSNSQEEARLIQVFADTAELPGLTFMTNDVRNLGYGPGFKLPHTPIYSDLNTTIMLDASGVILKFFHQWMQNIVNIQSDGDPYSSGYNGAKMYAVQYPSNYVTTISIMVFDQSENTIVVYDLNDAYPLRIGQPGLDWSSTNSILKLPVSFTFRTWTATTFAANDQELYNSISTFNPFARTISGSLYSAFTNSYTDISSLLFGTAISLINNNGTYSDNLLNIFK
jgi:hypothetical protein